MEHIGFSKLRERWKEGGGKMGYWLFRKDLGCRPVRSPDESDSSGIVRDSESGLDFESHGSGSGVAVHRFDRKVVLREGAQRNNFCILLL